MKTSIFLFVATLFIFTIGLGGQEVVNFDARFYLFALEMWRHGVSWFPTTYGVPYPDYPVASTFLIYLSASLFGGLTKWTAVFPSAAAAALTVVVTYHIGNLQNKRTGLYAVLMLLGTLAFFKSARSISLDMYTTLITAFCFYLVHSAAMQGRSSHSKWIYPLLVISFIFRGPIGLVMPTGVICVYYLLAQRFKRFFITGCIAFILLLLCVFGLLLIADHVGGKAFVEDVWRMEVMGRMGSQFLPLSFYFTDSLISYALSYPFALGVMLAVLVTGVMRRPMSTEMKFLAQLTGWALVIMLGMSIPGDKKVRYILPMAPAIALLAASLWSTSQPLRALAAMRKILIISYGVLPLLLCVATGYAWSISGRYELSTLPFLSLMIFFAVLQASNIYAYWVNSNEQRTLWLAIAGTITFIAANLFVIEPVELFIDRTRDFVQSVERLRLAEHANLAFYREHSDNLPIKYLVNMDQEAQPLFAKDEAQLQALQKPAVIVTSEEYFEALSARVRTHYRVLAKGRIGHVKVVVFIYDK
jgi:4-amino-4-deoxy-L-arabinose transferase-like glycosyltransferase